MTSRIKMDYSGMTVNERLLVAGLAEDFAAAARSRDRERMVEILGAVDLSDQSGQIASKILASPGFYGF